MLLDKSARVNHFLTPTLPALILAIIVASTLAACGGGGSSDDDDDDAGVGTATGQFKDRNTAGLSYETFSQSGITDSNGRFTYGVGEMVTFSVGGVPVGTTFGKSVITPVDLVDGGSSDSVRVQNIVRFLLMLDDDDDPSNGINISADVQSIAETWGPVDFDTANLTGELASIISDAVSVDSGGHILPDEMTAKAHLEETLGCVYAGAYIGTFTGDDRGNFGFIVHPDGLVEGIGYSVVYDEYSELDAAIAISFDQVVNFSSGFDMFQGSYQGSFTSVNTVSGTWEYPPDLEVGTFSGSRIGGTSDALYRFTGRYFGDDRGLFTFDIDSSNDVAGVAYSVIEDELYTLSGSVSGNTLSATSNDGGTISGTIDTSLGTLSGTWDDDFFSGGFDGSGCSLN